MDATSRESAVMMAAAIYEIRLLLQNFLGSQNEADDCVRLAAHLAYALHNQAEQILDGEEGFDLDVARDSIRAAENVVGARYRDTRGVLRAS